MTILEIFYRSKADRTTKLDTIANAGGHVLHDDFVDSNGKVTDGTSGRITYDDSPSKEPVRKITKTLDVALMELLIDRGVESDAELAKLKKILDREN